MGASVQRSMSFKGSGSAHVRPRAIVQGDFGLCESFKSMRTVSICGN